MWYVLKTGAMSLMWVTILGPGWLTVHVQFVEEDTQVSGLTRVGRSSSTGSSYHLHDSEKTPYWLFFPCLVWVRQTKKNKKTIGAIVPRWNSSVSLSIQLFLLACWNEKINRLIYVFIITLFWTSNPVVLIFFFSFFQFSVCNLKKQGRSFIG